MKKNNSFYLNLFDQNVESFVPLITPNQLWKKLPQTELTAQTVLNSRRTIMNILGGRDERKMLIVGPCSIHNAVEAAEYAKKLKALSDKVSDEFFILMRTYFEKPRTEVGWKGFVHDPDIDSSSNIQKGLFEARKLLIELNSLGVACATEALDSIILEYYFDLISYASVGARTTEAQTHREMASGLSMPIGFKNTTNGSVDVAIHAIKSSRFGHSFVGINRDAIACKIKATGNKYTHLILRGGLKPNFDSVSIKLAQQKLRESNLEPNIVVDCSHGNSEKDYRRQPLVFEDVVNQIIDGNKNIVGLMLESNLKQASQKIPKDAKQLKKGVSVTDACIDWETTEKIVLNAFEKLREKR